MTYKKWFDTVDSPTLCRGGGNGPFHPSQIEGLKLVNYGESLLDVGCGSATTLECIQKYYKDMNIQYKGVDFSEKHITWCVANFAGFTFGIEDGLLPNEKDDSWDVVWSRHLVDHMESFEKAIDAHLRVARRKVVCILWRPLGTQDEHEIKNIIDQDKVYKNEWTNDYSRKLVLKHLESKWPEWIPGIREGIGLENKKTDTLIYLEKNEK